MQETRQQFETPTPPCPACGALLPGRTAFCPTCGVPLLAATGRLPASHILAGRYRVIRLLARGGMGAVYLAEDLRLEGTQVAVKEMSSASARADADAMARAVADFKREAALLARLRHPNLPRVSDRFEEQGKHFLVMEYIHGRTLRDAIGQAGGRLPLAQALAYADQLCEVLAYLHGQQPPIIYRDLKPANVMVVADDGRSRLEDSDRGSPLSSPHPLSSQIVLIDFGIARFYRPGASGDTAVYGTLGYAPPEQYGQGQTDARTDVYALGVLLHHMLTGHDPSATPFALPPPRALDPSIPPRIAAAIERASTSDSQRRFTNVAELRAALHAHDAATRPAPRPRSSAPRPVPPAPAPAERPRASRGLFAWAIAAASLLVLGALLVLLLRGFEPTKSTGAAPTPAAPAATKPMVVATAPATAPVTLKPSGVSASGVLTPSIDSQGNTITYEPAQAIDGASDTAWRVSGDGIGQWLQLDFASPVGVTRVGLIPGYDKVDPFDGTDRFAQNRVVRRARLEFSDGTSFEATFERRRDLQFVQAPQPTRTRWIRIVILDTYPPATDREPRDATPISEVVVEGVR